MTIKADYRLREHSIHCSSRHLSDDINSLASPTSSTQINSMGAAQSAFTPMRTRMEPEGIPRQIEPPKQILNESGEQRLYRKVSWFPPFSYECETRLLRNYTLTNHYHSSLRPNPSFPLAVCSQCTTWALVLNHSTIGIRLGHRR